MGFGMAVGDRWVYPFSPQDYPDACRMVVGESTGYEESPGVFAALPAGTRADKLADGLAVLHTMLNRLHLIRHDPLPERGYGVWQPPHTYSRLLRCYSQPLIRYWATPYAESDPSIRDKRAAIASMPLRGVTPAVRDLVFRFMVGATNGRPYRGLVHFAACWDEFIERHGTPSLVIRNCFWKTHGHAAEEARVLPARPGVALTGTLLFAGSAVAAWKL